MLNNANVKHESTVVRHESIIVEHESAIVMLVSVIAEHESTLVMLVIVIVEHESDVVRLVSVMAELVSVIDNVANSKNRHPYCVNRVPFFESKLVVLVLLASAIYLFKKVIPFIIHKNESWAKFTPTP